MALTFNGSTQGVTTPTAVPILRNVASATQMAWFNISAFGSSGGIVQVGTNTLSGLSRMDVVLEPSGVITLGGRAPDSDIRQTIVLNSAISLNTWYHVAGTIDFATGAAALYLNGQVAATTGTMVFANPVTDNTDSAAFNFGSNEPNSGEFVNGSIGDVRVYGRALGASEIETIYACRGSDSILQDLQARYLPVGPEGSPASDTILNTISVNNPQGTLSSSSGTTLSLAYTVPSGNDLVMVVVAGAEGSNGTIQASSATFNSTSMTRITSLQVGGGGGRSGLAMFRLSVTAGTSSTVTVTYPGNASRRSMHVVVLNNCQSTEEAFNTASSGSGNTTASITTLTNGAVVVSGGISGNGNVLSTTGTGHVLDDARTPTSSASALGHVNVTTASTITGIGFTSSSTNQMVVILASFAPTTGVGAGATVIDLSDNKFNAVSQNGPVFQGTFLRNRFNNG